MPSFLSTLFSRLISALRSLKKSSDTPGTPSSPSAPPPASFDNVASRVMTIAWGQKVSQTFRDRIVWVADALGVPVDYLMAVIAFETGETFSPSIRNAAGSGATGLIQFMPATAIHFFHSPARIKAMSADERRKEGLKATDRLARMSAEDQLNYVYRYFQPYAGRLKTLSDVYMAVLWPAAIGKPEDTVLWRKGSHPTTYRQNAGLDIDLDHDIEKQEAAAKVQAKLDRGRQYAWTGEVKPT